VAGVTVRWVKGSPEQFRNMAKKIEQQLYVSLAQAMLPIAQNAAQRARAMNDRVDTGELEEQIAAEAKNTANSIIGRYGFVGQRKDYYLYQTITGFTHWLSGKYIEPSFALRNARPGAEAEIIAAIADAIRSVKLP
jgi:hypothetical protein